MLNGCFCTANMKKDIILWSSFFSRILLHCSLGISLVNGLCTVKAMRRINPVHLLRFQLYDRWMIFVCVRLPLTCALRSVRADRQVGYTCHHPGVRSGVRLVRNRREEESQKRRKERFEF